MSLDGSRARREANFPSAGGEFLRSRRRVVVLPGDPVDADVVAVHHTEPVVYEGAVEVPAEQLRGPHALVDVPVERCPSQVPSGFPGRRSPWHRGPEAIGDAGLDAPQRQDHQRDRLGRYGGAQLVHDRAVPRLDAQQRRLTVVALPVDMPGETPARREVQGRPGTTYRSMSRIRTVGLYQTGIIST